MLFLLEAYEEAPAATVGYRISGATGFRSAYNGDYPVSGTYGGYSLFQLDASHYIWCLGGTWYASTSPGSSPDLYGPTASTPAGGSWSDGSNPVTVTAL